MTETLVAAHDITEHTAARFTRSACAGATSVTPTPEFHRWWAAQHQGNTFEVGQIPFDQLDGWHFDPVTGNLAHDSGRFFTIEGLTVRAPGIADWSQPVIYQPEIGILGILVKEFDGVLHFLMQAKMEPGNVNMLQLSPTVQATRSNYTRVHKGASTRYLEYFLEPERGRVLVDVLQSEQGAWFWHKRNRNMVVEVTEDVPEYDDFRWLTLEQIRELMRTDNLVNMDARTVLACTPLSRPTTAATPTTTAAPTPSATPTAPPATGSAGSAPALSPAFREALLRSYDTPDTTTPSLHTHFEILSWFTEFKARCDMAFRLVPLSSVEKWTRTEEEITDEDRSRFRVIAVRVGAANREVTHWSQPLLAPRGAGLAAFLARPVGGVLHLLVQARPEPGLLDMVEMAPTVQFPLADGTVADRAPDDVPFADDVMKADPARVHFDVLLSEEGGRFYHAQTRYQIIEVGEDFPLEVPPAFRWMTVSQLMKLLDHGHHLNVEARSLVACLHSLW